LRIGVPSSRQIRVLQATRTRRRGLGRVWLFDPFGEQSSAWTPIQGCENWNRALMTAEWLGDAANEGHTSEAGHFWRGEAATLLAPLLYAAGLVGADMPQVLHWLHDRSVKEVLDILDTDHTRRSRAIRPLAGVRTRRRPRRCGRDARAPGVQGRRTLRHAGARPVATAARRQSIVIFESAWPACRMTRRTSNRFASSAIEMYVRRSVCGVVVGSAGSSRASGLVDARTAASRTIALTCWRVMPWHELAVTAQYLAGKNKRHGPLPVALGRRAAPARARSDARECSAVSLIRLRLPIRSRSSARGWSMSLLTLAWPWYWCCGRRS
jgi:hypothetical protein